MKIQHVLFDADGLLLKDGPRFSQLYAQKVNLPISEFSSFFDTEFILCETGKADLKEELVPFMSKWKWEGTVEEFVQEWLTTTTFVDERFIEVIKKLREQGIKCYLATNQEKYRSDYIRNILNADALFDACFYSFEVGYMKSTPQFFQHVIETLNVEPSSIALWDDGKKNVETAAGLGIEAYFYSDFEKFKQELENFLTVK